MARHVNLPVATVKYPSHLIDALYNRLGAMENGAVVLDRKQRVVFMNDAARALLRAPDGELPLWTRRHLASILSALAKRRTAIERWDNDNLLLRVRARPLRHMPFTLLEIGIARPPLERPVARDLSRCLSLRRSEAKLLELLWRGMDHTEIATTLEMPEGRVHTRLSSLFRKLEVTLPSAAVLRAARALAGAESA